jgi:tetrathionate reductase subunit B
MKAFVINLARCNGCYNCQIVCKDEHCGNDWTPYAKPQPDSGQFWMKMNESITGTIPNVRVYYLPVICQHCENAPCIDACPVEGGIYKRDDGLVIIAPDKCTGCQNCVDACPYGSIYFNTGLNIAQKCTGCAHLLDNGWTATRCSDACPTEGLVFGEESELDLNGTETLCPNYGLTTRVHYKNFPKKFVAGTVFDSIKDEVVIGATCTLTGTGSGTSTITTDGFGDFFFEGLAEDDFSLEIAANGYTSKTVSSISTKEESISLGDIDLA